jgi:hypothetical protein
MYPPIMNIAAQQFDILPAVSENEIIGRTLAVIKKITLNHFRLVAETQDKIGVPEVSVILHHMPKYRHRTDFHQRLWRIFSMIAKPHAETAAK